MDSAAQMQAAVDAIDLPSFEKRFAEIHAEQDRISEAMSRNADELADLDRAASNGPDPKAAAQGLLAGDDILQAVLDSVDLTARRQAHEAARAGLASLEREASSDAYHEAARLIEEARAAMDPVIRLLELRFHDALAELAQIEADAQSLSQLLKLEVVPNAHILMERARYGNFGRMASEVKAVETTPSQPIASLVERVGRLTTANKPKRGSLPTGLARARAAAQGLLT